MHNMLLIPFSRYDSSYLAPSATFIQLRLQKIDRYHVPSPICDRHSENNVRSLLRVMCWISRRTSAFPENFFILSELNRPSREDYGPGGLHDIFRSEFQARPVVLKHPRAFGMVRPSQRKTLEDVCHHRISRFLFIDIWSRSFANVR